MMRQNQCPAAGPQCGCHDRHHGRCLEVHGRPEPAADRSWRNSSATTWPRRHRGVEPHAAGRGPGRAGRPPLRRQGLGRQPGGGLHRADVPAERAHADADGRERRRRRQDQGAHPLRGAAVDRRACPEQLPGAQPRGAAEGAGHPGREHRHRHAASAGRPASKGHVSQTDESGSRSAATSPPPRARWCSRTSSSSSSNTSRSRAKVHERPMLFVPPCINKYYILDLQPENSVIRYDGRAGPPHLRRELAQSGRVDGRQDLGRLHRAGAADPAIRMVQAITGAETINTLGFCVGGTILATALAVLAARGEQPATVGDAADHAARLRRHRHPRHLHRRSLASSCAR